MVGGNKRSLFGNLNGHSSIVTQILLEGALQDLICATEVSNLHHKLQILDYGSGLRMTRLLVITVFVSCLCGKVVCRLECDWGLYNCWTFTVIAWIDEKIQNWLSWSYPCVSTFKGRNQFLLHWQIASNASIVVAGYVTQLNITAICHSIIK